MRKDVSRLSVIIATAAALALTVPLVAQQASGRQQQEQQKQQQPQQGATAGQPAKVDLDDLEKNPEKYLGKTVTVEGEVGRVLGPHLFTIDEKDWVDLDREMPVAVPEPFTAIVRGDGPVRVTGIIEKLPIAKVEQEGGIIRDPKIKAEIETKPVLVATEVTTVTPAAAVVSLRVPIPGAVGTSGSNAQTPLTDTNQVASANNNNLVGRRVSLTNATVSGMNSLGFWVRTASGERLFVMPVKKTAVKDGQTVAVEGVVLEMPEGLKAEVGSGEPVYVYADRVTAR
jgi:uncharacterized protein YdeI (BOF family)